MVATIALTWLVAWNVQSPAQRDAAREAPPKRAITVAITRGDLTDTRQIGAKPQAATSSTITLPTPGETAVVSRVGTQPGQTLTAGAVIAWVNDRPILALPGAFPLWRDLHEGDRGSDVTSLQNGLRQAGYTIAADGIFGPATTRALTALYQRHHTQPPTAPAPTPQNTKENGATDQADTPPAPVPTASRTELIFLPALPATLQKVPAVGTTLTADTAAITVGTGTPSLVGTVDGTTAAALSVGLTAHAKLPGGDIPLTLSQLSATPGTTDGSSDAAATSTSDVVFTPTDNSALLAGIDADTPVTVTVNISTPVTDTLLVPERALATQTNGTQSVLVEIGDTEFRHIPVDVTGCAEGMCAITSTDTTIREGALVRVDRTP